MNNMIVVMYYSYDQWVSRRRQKHEGPIRMLIVERIRIYFSTHAYEFENDDIYTTFSRARGCGMQISEPKTNLLFGHNTIYEFFAQKK